MSERFITLVLLVTAFAVCVSAQKASKGEINKDLADLASAERAFAATAVKEGFRDSFIKFFADDGIGFGPHPQRTREELQKAPAQTGPRRVIFNWQPMFGDISLAGDLGYTTGPVLFTEVTADPKPPRHGMYFSVWQKQSDGTWKVVVDMGTDMPQAVAGIDVSFTASKRQDAIAKPGTANQAYKDLDSQLSADLQKHGVAKGYLSHLDDEFRFHRGGHLPILTKGAFTKYFAVNGQKIAYTFIGGKAAASNDISFSYGSFRNEGSVQSIDGYYVHVWRKNADGHWKLVADILNDLPKN